MAEANGAVEEREKMQDQEHEMEGGMPLFEINKDARCPDGYVYVKPHKNFYGVYVRGFCRKSKKRHIL